MKSLLVFLVVLLVCSNTVAQKPALDRFVTDHAKKNNFNGTVLVRENGRNTYAKSFGLANFKFKVPNTNNTKYKIASITKAFTAVLILQLREEGKLDLGKTIKAFLPDYAGEAGDKTTVHQLLNHTSGIDNFDKVKSAEDAINNGLPTYQRPYTSDQLLAKFCSGPLVAAPGKAFDYNNADYIILGKIIERIDGKTFEAALKTRILEPLRLKDTGMMHQNAILEGLADTYFFRDDLKTLVNDFPVYPENWFAAGSMYSTASDIMSFANSLFGAKLLKKESLDLMFKPGLDDYGYGVWAYDTKIDGKSYRVVKRPGQIMGAQTQLYHFLDKDITVVILSNTGTTDLDRFVAEIGKVVVRF
ncbi:MAG: serine hydrolase domain-containing protein [Pyrinomonadaceae bacterium]